MDLFLEDDYKNFIDDWVKNQPKNGRGQFRKIAQHLNVSPVIVTQVVRGDRHFSAEQALELTEFLGLSELETDYFLLLVQCQRAGSYKLKSIYKKKISQLQDKADQVKGRLPKNKILKEEAKATFYSNWYYSGIRLSTAIESCQTPEAISESLSLPLATVRTVLEFLVENGLCEKQEDRYLVGVKSTHVDAKSPLVSRHHKNWREIATRRTDQLNDRDLFFTAPTVVDEKAVEKIRAALLSVIEECAQVASDAPSEELRCLTIDWFKV